MLKIMSFFMLIQVPILKKTQLCFKRKGGGGLNLKVGVVVRFAGFWGNRINKKRLYDRFYQVKYLTRPVTVM